MGRNCNAFYFGELAPQGTSGIEDRGAASRFAFGTADLVDLLLGEVPS